MNYHGLLRSKSSALTQRRFLFQGYVTGLPVDVLHTDSPGDLAWLTSLQAFKANLKRQRSRVRSDVTAGYSGITAEGKAFLTLWQSSEEKNSHLAAGFGANCQAREAIM